MLQLSTRGVLTLQTMVEVFKLSMAQTGGALKTSTVSVERVESSQMGAVSGEGFQDDPRVPDTLLGNSRHEVVE